MASLKRSIRKSVAIRDPKALKFDGHISPDIDLNASNSALLKSRSNMQKKSASSFYISNSRSGAYAIGDDFNPAPLNPSLYKVIYHLSLIHLAKQSSEFFE